MLTLELKKRDIKADKEGLRDEGILPAVFYGKKTESTPVSVSMSEFRKVLREAGESTVISLKEGSDSHEALIQDVDIHPVTGDPVHADFYVLEKGQKVNVTIQLEFIGESPAVKSLNGVLVKAMQEIDVEAEASKLPNNIEVDISALVDFESRITVSDLKLPEGVVAEADGDEVVVLATEAQEEEEIEVEAPDMDSIEVEKKGKAEESESSEGSEPKEESKE